MNIEDIDILINILEKECAPLDEIKQLIILKKEQEWMLLSSSEKQKKRKFALEYVKKLSDADNIQLNYEESIVHIYDLGNDILLKLRTEESDGLLIRLKIMITIEQELINEYAVNKLYSIRHIDIDISSSLIQRIKVEKISKYIDLNLYTYEDLLNRIWMYKMKNK